MIIGHGIDIVEIERFRSMSDHRLRKIALRICTEDELNEFINHPRKYQYLSKIWAAKEAIAKSFGKGIRNEVTWKNIKIKNNDLGQPTVWFNEKLKGPFCHLSISHEKDYLIASAILEIYD